MITNTDAALHFVSHGQGSPVLLLHGMAASSRDWDLLLPAISNAGYQAYAPDLLGHGESAKPAHPDAYTVANVYASLEAWITSLQLNEPFFLIGHSLGGYLSLEYARRHPDHLKGMVLLDPLFSPHQISPLFAQLLKRAIWGETALRHSPAWLISTVMGLDPLAASTVPRWVRRQTALDYKRASPQIMHIPASVQDLSDQAASLQAPSLVIWGKMDLTLHPDSFPRLVSMLPEATGYALERTGHQPHIQRPREVRQLVLDFLRRQAATAHPSAGYSSLISPRTSHDGIR